MEGINSNTTAMWTTEKPVDKEWVVPTPEDNHNNRVQVYIVMGILAFFSVLGTIGNALVIYVFYRKRDKSVATLFIMALAFVDFTTCLVVVPYTMTYEYFESRLMYDGICKLYQFFITSNIPFSAFVMVAIAIDRYFCICHPFLHAITPRRAKYIIGILGMFAFTLGVLTSLIYGVYRSAERTVPIMKRANISQPMTVLGSLNFHSTQHEEFFGNIMKDITRVLLSDNKTELLIYQPDPNITYVIKNQTLTLTGFDGRCWPNTLIFSPRTRFIYHKVYTSLFCLALIVTLVLYVLIYRSVLARRKKRQKQKAKLPLTTGKTKVKLEAVDDNPTLISCQTQTTSLNNKPAADASLDRPTDVLIPLKTVTGDPTPLNSPAVEAVTPLNSPMNENGTEQLLRNDVTETRTVNRAVKNKKALKKDHIANLKTAVMLFVVTIVFIVTYLPSFLMALKLIPYQMVVFYMYFANNVANPVIYSFMNRNFRDDLKQLFTQCKRRRH